MSTKKKAAPKKNKDKGNLNVNLTPRVREKLDKLSSDLERNPTDLIKQWTNDLYDERYGINATTSSVTSRLESVPAISKLKGKS